MALRFIDSCGDYYPTAQIPRKWTANLTGAILTNGRRGGQGLDGSNTRWYSKTLDAQSTWTVGFAYKYTTAPATDNPILIIMDGATEQVSLRMEGATGKLKFTRNGTLLGTVSVAAPSAAVEHYIEVKTLISDTVGTYDVRVDGVSVISGTAQDTKNTANTTADTIRFNTTINIGAAMFDDIYILDGTGSAPLNTFLGDVRADAYLPTGVGNSSGLTPSAGANWQNVDDNPANDDTDYNSSAVVATKDTYAFADMTHTPVTIFGVQIITTAKKDDAGARSIASVTRSGGADYDGATIALATSYDQYREVVVNDPNTAAAWTKTNFNAAEFGVKVAA